MVISDNCQHIPFRPSIARSEPIPAFLPGNYDTAQKAWKYALNPDYWTHCLAVTLGNGLSISEADAKRRLSYIAVRLKRNLWGNRHQKQGKIEFIAFHHSDANNKHKKSRDKEVGGAFRHGRSASSHEHYHAFMHVGGGHGQSNQEIASAIREIERARNRLPRDKEVHVDSDWWNGNSFHGYVTRQVNSGACGELIKPQ